MIGTLLKETYRVVQPLGEGGMGTLYVAEHKTLCADVQLARASAKQGRKPPKLR